MSSIQVVSTTSVHPTNSKNHGEINPIIQLTPCDLKLLLVGPIQKGLLFQKPKNQSIPPDHCFIRHLKTSLSRTLDYFPNLAGRLVRLDHEDNTASFSIHCNNAGAMFVHAIADGVTVVDILKPLYSPSALVQSFFPLNKTINSEGVTIPLFGVQVTELADGIFIGCTMNHAIADGTSFWSFFNSWSSISRDLHHVPRSPVFDFSCLDSERFPIRIPLSILQKAHKFVLPTLLERVFHFKKEAISDLKAKVNKEAGFFNKISSLQSLLALIWLTMIRASPRVDPQEEYTVSIAIGLRQRLNPPLPNEYFGNGILFVKSAGVKAGKLLELGLGFAALQVNDVVTSHTEEKIRADIDHSIKNPQMKALAELVSNSVSISSSPRFNVYGNDFGWGKPVAVRSGAGNKFDGKFTLFPGAEEGSIDIEVCVAPETLHAMENDLEFMSTVSAE